MDFVVFYVGAVLLFGSGAMCIRNTSPYSRSGGDNYLKRDRRRLIGKTLLALGALSLALGLLVQFVASNS